MCRQKYQHDEKKDEKEEKKWLNRFKWIKPMKLWSSTLNTCRSYESEIILKALLYCDDPILCVSEYLIQTSHELKNKSNIHITFKY